MNVARHVFALQLNDHSLSTSAVQFAVQDVNSLPAASAAPETDTFEQVSNISWLFLLIIIDDYTIFYWFSET